MTVTQSLLAYVAAAGVLTVTPGLDTALVLRTAAVGGARAAGRAGGGVILGCLAWGVAAAVGLSALLTASRVGFEVLKWVGAIYLAWTGLQLILRPRDTVHASGRADLAGAGEAPRRSGWLRRGLLTNLLNPKVGVFYVTFLPQFVPAGVRPVPFLLLLAVIHAVLGVIWFAILIAATHQAAGVLRRPAVVRTLDWVTGVIFVAFGIRLAMESRR